MLKLIGLNKNMKKIICMMVVLCLSFTMIVPVLAADAVQINIKIGDAQGNPGDTIRVPVFFSGSVGDGINNLNFKLKYDTNIFEVVNTEPGSIVTYTHSFDSYAGVPGEITFLYNDVSQGNFPIKTIGEFAIITLKIKNNTTNGLYEISLKEVGSFSGKDLKDMSTVFVPSSVNVGNVNYTPTPKPSKSTPVTTSGNKTSPTPTPILVIQQNLPKLPGIIPADLVVSVTADKSVYAEQSVITYNIKYLNRLNKSTSNVTVTAEIPQYTVLYDKGDGTQSGNTVQWNLGNLDNNATGELVYKVTVNQLTSPQVETSNTVSINSADNAVASDNKSTLKVMLYSNSFGPQQHNKYIKGYPNNTFKPENNITRAEVAVMFANILNLDISNSSGSKFSDVSAKHWAVKYISAVSEKGIMQGANGKYRPNDPVTRAELATAIFRYMNLSNVTPLETHFSDLIGHWSWKYVEEVYRLKIVSGYGAGKFAPNNKIKRSEAVTMLNKMLYRGPLKGITSPFSDLKTSHWAFGQIVEGTADHKYNRVIDGSEALNN